jgi:hypothetical protein
MAKTLADLVKEKKTLKESEMKGATGGGKAAGPDEDGGTSKPALGGTVKPVTNGDGAKDAPKDFEPKNGDMGNTKSVNREAGAKAGVKETGEGDKNIGKKEAVENAKPVDRKEGSTDAPKEFLGEFRSKVRSALGLPLDSELNQGNKGLNK